MSGWDEFTITLDEKDASLLCDALVEMGALGLQVEDDQSLSIPEHAPSNTHRARVVASFESSVENALAIQSQLNEFLATHSISSAIVVFAHIPEQDYAKQFQQSWKSFSIGAHIWIVPSWEEEFFKTDDKDAIVIHMDPELAFGTGQHETTKLCTEAVFDAVKTADKPVRVLDVGTGTGILAFVGILAGAESAVGTDIDPEAIGVAQANAKKNHLSNRVRFSDADPDELGEQFEIVVANILALPLIALAEQIVRAIKPGGTLFLSGLLASQIEDVAKAYRALGLVNENAKLLGEWALLSFVRPK